MYIIYHNTRCRKSREALAALKDSGKEVEIREYLKVPPSKEELTELLQKLNKRPQEILRKNETLFKEKYKGGDFSDVEWIQILADNPILIERPIVINGSKAVLGRPVTNLEELL